MNKKIIYIIASILIMVGYMGFNYYQKIFGKAITQDNTLFVFSTDNLMDVKTKISAFSNKPQTFLWVAAKKNFSKPKSGRYLLTEGMSNNDLINLLRSGNQSPIKVSFNNQNTLEKFAGRISHQIEVDSISLLKTFTDSTFLAKNNFNKKSVLGIFIPNSYEFYWNISAKNFRNKMLKEYHKFWTQNRIAKAKNLKLSKQEVITLASIVQKETAKKSERPTVAGLYLNRLKKGWPLQADPTVIYTIKEKKGQDFIIKRVLTKDLEINSPYNTYINKGLPPTLIAMPDISAIDAVLNAKKHKYMYMTASVTNIGFHEFASTLSQHNRNAAKYHRWLNKQRILR